MKYFLRLVRRESFIDYLDPLGETVEEAFARRLLWADAHRDDPACMDEAQFLLVHTEALGGIIGQKQTKETEFRASGRLLEETPAAPQLPTFDPEDVPPSHEEPMTWLTRMEDLTPVTPVRAFSEGQEVSAPAETEEPYLPVELPPQAEATPGCTPGGKCNEGLLARIPHAELWGLAVFLLLIGGLALFSLL
ncbi:MAG: hypothetical protein JXX28_14230 [Deltaproteobacteria bacterium]|nr:hypothetical protein [Deltaproteobacteria bacterium]